MLEDNLKLRKEIAWERILEYRRKGFQVEPLKSERGCASVSFWKPGASNFKMRITIPYANEDHAIVYERWLPFFDRYARFFESNTGWVDAAAEILQDCKNRKEVNDGIDGPDIRAKRNI